MLIFLLFFWLVLFPNQVNADVSSRFVIEAYPTFTGTAGVTGVSVKAKLAVSESDSSPSINESAEFRITNARTGDACSTQGGQGPTNNAGEIFATCTANEGGDVKIYAYSLDHSDWSAETNITFNAPPTTSTPIPAAPTNTPTSSSSGNTPTPVVTKSALKKTTNTQQGGFGGNGLIEDKEVDSGLGFDKDNVQGASTTQNVDSTGDKDLLTTLIFLTGAVVLIVWTVYMILIQKGVIKSGTKKDKHPGGITPQPLQ